MHEPFCETQQPKMFLEMLLKMDFRFCFSFSWRLCKNSSLSKEFSVKKCFLVIQQKPTLRRLRLEMKLYLNISCGNTDEEKLLLPVAFEASWQPTLPWSRSLSTARYKLSSNFQAMLDKCFPRAVRAPTPDQRFDMLLNIFLLCVLRKHCTMHR